ncbi:MAG: hypothetical protein IPP74_09570 [Alphaproteobacteria bacterium]|nr:hypothetical protein [Alphaproteobacteria bacterium]
MSNSTDSQKANFGTRLQGATNHIFGAKSGKLNLGDFDKLVINGQDKKTITDPETKEPRPVSTDITPDKMSIQKFFMFAPIHLGVTLVNAVLKLSRFLSDDKKSTDSANKSATTTTPTSAQQVTQQIKPDATPAVPSALRNSAARAA